MRRRWKRQLQLRIAIKCYASARDTSMRARGHSWRSASPNTPRARRFAKQHCFEGEAQSGHSRAAGAREAERSGARAKLNNGARAFVEKRKPKYAARA